MGYEAMSGWGNHDAMSIYYRAFEIADLDPDHDRDGYLPEVTYGGTAGEAGERGTDRRIIATQAESIRRWAARHAAAEARLRRWQAAWGVTLVLALGYVLVYSQIGR